MAHASHGLELEHEAVVLLLLVEVSVICHMKLVMHVWGECTDPPSLCLCLQVMVTVCLLEVLPKPLG